MDLFDRYLEDPTLEPITTPEPDQHGFRSLKITDAPNLPDLHRPSLAEARLTMRKVIHDYLKLDTPDYMLLLRPSPGAGKTTAAVEAAVQIGRAKKRVMYAGPRHNFFYDVTDASFKYDPKSVSLWYEWLPRQMGDEDGKGQTCMYTHEINDWMNKGYNAMDFCKGVCGWDCINSTCPYHAQKRIKNPLIFTQHAHLTLGHPLEFDVVFGDENPLGAFCHERTVYQKNVFPASMPPGPLRTMLTTLSFLVSTEKPLFGENLIMALGGPEAVLTACQAYTAPDGAQLFVPNIASIDDAKSAPVYYLNDLLPLLSREAQAVKEGRDYPKRIFASKNRLRLLLRRELSDKLPPHLIWLDGTGNARIYEEIFGRPVVTVDARPKLQGKVYQVWDRANGKSTLVKPKEDGDFKGRRSFQDIERYQEQTITTVNAIIKQHNYQQPALITFKDIKKEFEIKIPGEIKVGHFGGERGSNQFENCDAVFVIGTPMPNLYDLEAMAAQIFFKRDLPFNANFYAIDQAYHFVDEEGKGYRYPVSGYWDDPDLQAVLETMREDEIVQAAHRVRPVSRSAEVWLFTNLPIAQLAPDVLLSMRNILAAPEGVDMFKWQQLCNMLELCVNEGEAVTLQDVADIIDVSLPTAAKYMDILETLPGWQRSITKVATGRGRPQRKITKAS